MTDQLLDVLHYLQVHRAHGPSWSPDGNYLAFIADISGLDQVWILNLATQEQHQITHFPDRVGLVHWSPCDQQMIVTVDAGGNEHDSKQVDFRCGSCSTQSRYDATTNRSTLIRIGVYQT